MALQGTDENSEIAPEDWTLLDPSGMPLARLYKVTGGPQDGRAWRRGRPASLGYRENHAPEIDTRSPPRSCPPSFRALAPGAWHRPWLAEGSQHVVTWRNFTVAGGRNIGGKYADEHEASQVARHQ